MHTLKKGHAFLTIFFITSALFVTVLSVVRVYTIKTDILTQRYYHWNRYYSAEGCLEYMYAYFCKNPELHSFVIAHDQGDHHYIIHAQRSHTMLKGIVMDGEKHCATLELVLEKDESSWTLKKRTVTLH